MKKWIKQGGEAFMGYIRKVEEPVPVVPVSTTGSDVEKALRSEMPQQIKDVLEEFEDIFPVDLPRGIPPVRMGHEFKIELEDDAPLVHRSIYKLSPLELEEAKKQIEYMLEHGFIQPSNSPYGAPVEGPRGPRSPGDAREVVKTINYI